MRQGRTPQSPSYIKDNNIQESPVKRGDPGSPTIDLPVPDGWEPAGEDTPDWAYSAIVYTGPDAGEYTPSIVAQKTVVIPGSDGLYVLQLNADGLEDPEEMIGAATDVIDSQTTITP